LCNESMSSQPTIPFRSTHSLLSAQEKTSNQVSIPEDLHNTRIFSLHSIDPQSGYRSGAYNSRARQLALYGNSRDLNQSESVVRRGVRDTCGWADAHCTTERVCERIHVYHIGKEQEIRGSQWRHRCICMRSKGPGWDRGTSTSTMIHELAISGKLRKCGF
jgi:hypothetical protein